MIIIMPFCGVYRRFGFVFCYTRPPRFHEQHFPSSCEEKKELDSIKKEELDTALYGFPDRSNAARDKDWRNEFRERWQEICPFLVIAVFTARLC